MTKQQKQKIAIAKDVIAQVKAQRFVATTGTYAELYDLENGDLQKQLRKVKSCEVCALGSAFLSQVRLYDKFEVSEMTREEWGESISAAAMKRKLREIFKPRELQTLEASFELESGFLKVETDRRAWRGYSDERAWHEGTLEGYQEFLSDMDEDTRLIWLMNVIVKHGTFSLQVAVPEAWEAYKATLNPADMGFVA